jgi:hypothetical protein
MVMVNGFQKHAYFIEVVEGVVKKEQNPEPKPLAKKDPPVNTAARWDARPYPASSSRINFRCRKAEPSTKNLKGRPTSSSRKMACSNGSRRIPHRASRE